MNSNTKTDEPIAEVSADETVDWKFVYEIIYELLNQNSDTSSQEALFASKNANSTELPFDDSLNV
jgi:hypothetical protein